MPRAAPVAFTCVALLALTGACAAQGAGGVPASPPVTWASLLGGTPGQGEPLPNIAYLEPLAAFETYHEWLNSSDSVLAIEEAVVLRISASNGMVPFTVEKQRILLEAANATILEKLGPVELVFYREGIPDPASPDYETENQPYVDLAVNVYHVITAEEIDRLQGSNSTFENAFSDEFASFLAFTAAAIQMGLNGTIRLASLDTSEVILEREILPRPIRMIDAYLAVNSSAGPDLTVQQTSEVEKLVAWYTDGWLTTLVAAYPFIPSLATGEAGIQAAHAVENGSAVLLAVAVVACEGGGEDDLVAVCEEQRLAQALEMLPTYEDFEGQLRSAGIESLEVISLGTRPVPTLPESSTSDTWLPWHLDRIDQRSLPLDSKFTATADGTGVNVYVLSSGVRADHSEFGYLDGRPGSRVRAAWGYEGLDPLQDCEDAFAWYGFGTYAAGLIAGLKQGVAKNATIHSVRFRSQCVFENSEIWQPGGLPSAIDAVISAHTQPAIMVIDTWWSRRRLSSDDDQFIMKALNERLDRAYAAGITVVSSAGIGFSNQPPCDNIIGAHNKTISVAGTNSADHISYLGPTNSPCITLFAPGGEAGNAMVSAYPGSNTSFIGILPRGFGAAWLTAGVAAQYLQLHPKASPDEVKNALVQWSTTDKVIAAGVSPNRLLYTNFTRPAAAPETGGAAAQVAPSSGGGGLSIGATAGIAVGAALVAGVLAGLFAYRRHQRWVRRGSPLLPYSDGQFNPPPLDSSDWEINPSQIAISKLPDGSDWELGRGSYGRVFRAVRDEVQVVAVKTIARAAADEARRDLFIREIALMKYVSRDANIVQFYGACVSGPEMMLVVELMEGGDLRRALTQDRAGELRWWRRGKGAALDITRGLHFLHRSGVIHRDIKSKNILLTREGRAKITDVGLARLFEGDNYFSDGAMGTFAWAGPEVLLGERCGTACDIYSLGVVLWELATQEVPIRGALRSPQVPAECPQELVAIIEACMQRDPAKRPSAREVFERLCKCPPLDHDEVLSLPSTAGSLTPPIDSMDSKESKVVGSDELPPSPPGPAPTPAGAAAAGEPAGLPVWQHLGLAATPPPAGPPPAGPPPAGPRNPTVLVLESQIRDRMQMFNPFAQEAATVQPAEQSPGPEAAAATSDDNNNLAA